MGSDIISGVFENSILVQITQSIYEKQMETTASGVQELFGADPRNIITNKTRTFSESKNLSNAKKKLGKI